MTHILIGAVTAPHEPTESHWRSTKRRANIASINKIDYIPPSNNDNNPKTTRQTEIV
jgi:hypothetical protein